MMRVQNNAAGDIDVPPAAAAALLTTTPARQLDVLSSL